MRITCPKDILIENINVVSKAVSNRSTMQILECILVTAGAEGVKMTANDMEMGIETDFFAADVISAGSVALDAKLFSDIIRKMPDGDIQIDVDSNNVTIIKNNQAELKILGLSGDEFPHMPEFTRADWVSVGAAVFKNMIRQTAFSISIDNSKPVFTGGLIEIKDGFINLVTVDGFRISFRREAVTLPEKDAEGRVSDIKAIVPGRTLNEINKILSSEPDAVLKIYFTDKHALFEQSGFTLLSRLIEGDFLRYEKNFTAEYLSVVSVGRAELSLSLDRAMLIARDSIKNPVDIKLEKEKIIISSNTETGTVRDEIPAELTGDALSISFNPRYLSDVVKIIDDDKIDIKFNSRLSPCVIEKDNGDSSYKYLILPLRSWN